MHIYAGIRGTKANILEFENFLSSQYFPVEIKDNKTGKIVPAINQLQVREVKLLEIICPAKEENKVMGMLKPSTDNGFGGKFAGIARWLAKLMGIKKPSTKWKPSILPIHKGISVMCLGTKKDRENFSPTTKELDDKAYTPREML